MTAMKQAVAYLFRRSGEPALGEDALIRQVSLDLHWFSPRDARRFVEAAKARGLVVAGAKDGHFVPGFDVNLVDVPLGFRVGPEVLGPEAAATAPAREVAQELAELAAAARKSDLESVWADIRHKEEEGLLKTPAAALVVAAEAGANVKPFVARVREAL
jgi:hypothetical protein